MSALPSTLDAVVVYREGAVCRRLARVEPSGSRTVLLGRLPLSLEPGSLRASLVSGAGKVVDVRAEFDVELADEADVPAEQKALEEADQKLRALSERHARLEAELAELNTLRPVFPEPKRGEAPRPAPVDAMVKLGEFRERELTPRLEERRALNESIADARREQELRKRRLAEASSSKRAERARVWRVANITLAEPPTGPLELALEYRVPGARWVPSYALTMDRALTSGALQLRASVVQQTGEDWSHVALSLSTAASTRSAQMPELKALKLGRSQEKPAPSGWRAPPPGLDALFESYDAAFLMPEQPKLRSAPRPVMAPPPPPPAPMAAPAPSMMMMESAAVSVGPPPGTARRAMAAAPMAKKASRGRMMAQTLGGAGGARDEAEAAPAPEEAMADEDLGFEEPAPREPEHGLGAAFTDYARLVMPAATARATRGRLVETTTQTFIGVSMQLDFVALVSTAQRIASHASSAALPALTNPVTAVRSFDYRYETSARVDVPSTGQWVLVPVMACSVGLTPEYVCVPSVEQKVYRTLAISNRSTHALLPGPVDVTVGDEFLLTTSLPAIPPGAAESHRLGLGVEESIKVSRKTRFNETTGGLLNNATLLPHEVELELNNRLGAPAVIEVRERVPVADGSEKDLKIEESTASPPWEKVDGPVDGVIVKGARRWRITLAPGQTQKLTAAFTIRMPSSSMVEGGNRRS